MKQHNQLTLSLIQEEKLEQILLKVRRQQKAVAEFSKQKFIKRSMKTDQNHQQTKNNEFQNLKLKKQKQKVDNLKVNLLQILKSKNVDFNDPIANISWLPLSAFDQCTYEPVINAKLLQSLLDKENHIGLNCRCLIKYKENYTFVYGKVQQYNPTKNTFCFTYEDVKKVKLSAPRIYLCFDNQNPYRYCDRVAKAFNLRIKSNSQYQFKQMVKKIPTIYVGSYNKDQMDRIQKMVNRQNKFDHTDIDPLFEEIIQDFKFSMNTMMFRKCLEKHSHDIIPHGLVDVHQNKQQAPYFGLPSKSINSKQIVVSKDGPCTKPVKSFIKTFQQFCQRSLLISKEIVISLQAIKNQCYQLREFELFKIQMVKITNTKETKQPYRFQHFQSDQNVYTQKALSKIKMSWTGSIRSAVEKQFRKGLLPWFNMNQKDKQVYQQSKTKRYFQQVKYMMEDTLLCLCLRSFTNYSNYVKRFIPSKVKVLSPSHVINTYQDGYIIDSTIPQTYQRIKSKLCLFQTDLMKLYDESGFGLATLPTNFMNVILNGFDKMLDELAKIPQIQSKCMIQLFKKDRGEKYLKTPNRFSESQDNIWIKNLYQDLKEALQRGIEPVGQYIKQFDQFVSVLKMKPEEYIKQIQKEDEENPKDVLKLKQEIMFLQQKQLQLLQKMPQCIRVGIFKIHLKQTNQKLAAKYNSTAKGLELLIAKKARKICKGIMQKYDQIKLKIKFKPKDIQKLVQLKEFLNNIPSDLQIIKEDVKSLDTIYNILDQLRYVIPQQDLKRKYQMLLCPKQILDDITRRREELSSKNMQFSQSLRIQQQQFKLTLEGRARTVAQFGMYSKREQYKQIIQKVQIILSSLQKCEAQAKKFNLRQQLFQRPITDYSKIDVIQKEFMNYANYWVTLDKWMEYSEKWLHSIWQLVDPFVCVRFIQQSIKKLIDSSSFFLSRDLSILSQNADSLRVQIQQFKTYIPILIALKGLGHSQKGWAELSEKVGVKLTYNSFTFNKVREIDIQKHIQFIKQFGERMSKQGQEENRESIIYHHKRHQKSQLPKTNEASKLNL